MPSEQPPLYDSLDDLAPLAEQLSADSSRLEATFPARTMPAALAAAIAALHEPHVARPRNKWPAIPWMANSWATRSAAAMAACVALCGAWAWQAGVFRAAAPPTDSFGQLPINPAKSVDGHRTPIPGLQPAGWFENYDSSEQEGVLDLIEQQREEHEKPIEL